MSGTTGTQGQSQSGSNTSNCSGSLPPLNPCDIKIHLFKFQHVLCYYYTAVSDGLTTVLANVPLMVLLSPALIVSLFLYVFYIVSYPVQVLVCFLFPSVEQIVVPLTIVFLTGFTSVRLSKYFSRRA